MKLQRDAGSFMNGTINDTISLYSKKVKGVMRYLTPTVQRHASFKFFLAITLGAHFTLIMLLIILRRNQINCTLRY